MQLREEVLKSNITRAQRLVLDNGLQGQMEQVATTALRKLAPTTTLPTADLMTDEGQALSTVLRHFLQSTEASLLVTGSAADIAQAALISQHCQWAYFAQCKRLAPIVVDLAQLQDPLHHVLPQTLWQAGYRSSELEAFTQGHPGLVLLVTNWDASKHCTNLWSRNRLHQWGTLAGTAPKVVFLVASEQLPAGLDETAELYFVAADAADEPVRTSLQHVCLAGKGPSAPISFEAEHELHEASSELVPPSQPTAKTSPQTAIDVDQLFQRASRTMRQVRAMLGKAVA